MNSQQIHAQLRYLPSAQPIYATPPNQAIYQQRYGNGKYSIKRPRYEEDPTMAYEEDGSPYQPPLQHPTSAVVAHHQQQVPYQIRHRSTDKTRGLRHFAHKVCEKVKEKGQTNYNEVAEELVTEYFENLTEIPQDPEKYQYDVRNIRRRVYDALNVLMAMNIIEKEKKEIRWVGLPTSSLAECRRLEEEKTQRKERIRIKTEQLQELIVQLVAYKSLVQRNRERERQHGRPANSSILYLPYIIVSTDKKTMVECAIAPDKSEYWFNFDRPFEIHDDIEVLKRLGLAYGIDRCEVMPENVQHIKACLPPALRDYVDQILEGTLIDQKAETIKTIMQSTEYPHSSANRSADTIVVRATRANLSGVASSGDGGPMGSFLAPINQQQIAKSQPQQPIASSIARYAVIPRPVSARYPSVSSSRYGQPHHLSQQAMPVSQSQPLHHQYAHSNQRLGGVLHYEVPVHPSRDPMLYRQRPTPMGGAAYGLAEETMLLEGGYQIVGEEGGYLVEEYVDADGEQIIEEVVTEE